MTHEPSRKKCLITGRTLNATAFGKSGCSSYSKKAINHYQLLRRTVNEQGYELSIADYREYMGYPPLVHGNLNTEAQQEGAKVIQFFKNRSAEKRGDFQKQTEVMEIVRQPRLKKCGNCGTLGHNRRTCPELVEQVEQPVGRYSRRIVMIGNWLEQQVGMTVKDVDDDTFELISMNVRRMERTNDESKHAKYWSSILMLLRPVDNSPIRRGRPSSK